MNLDRSTEAVTSPLAPSESAGGTSAAERRCERVVRHWDSRTKEAELNYAVLTYAARCLTEGDIDALREIGFEPEDIEVIDELRLSDLHALAASRAHALNVRIDREALHWLVEHVRRRRARDALRLELLRMDAPSDMMTSLFGMTGRGYTATRDALGIVGGHGRPASHLGDEAEESKLWALWVQLADIRRPSRLRHDDLWLVLARELPTGLRSAWNIIQQWARDEYSVRSLRDERAKLTQDQLAAEERELRERHGVHRLSINPVPRLTGTHPTPCGRCAPLTELPPVRG